MGTDPGQAERQDGFPGSRRMHDQMKETESARGSRDCQARAIYRPSCPPATTDSNREDASDQQRQNAPQQDEEGGPIAHSDSPRIAFGMRGSFVRSALGQPDPATA